MIRICLVVSCVCVVAACGPTSRRGERGGAAEGEGEGPGGEGEGEGAEGEGPGAEGEGEGEGEACVSAGGNPDLQIFPEGLQTLRAVPEGEPPESVRFAVENFRAPLCIGRIAIEPAGTDFRLDLTGDGACRPGAVVPVSRGCGYTVVYEDTDGEDDTAEVVFESDFRARPSWRVPLRGVAAAPRLVVEPEAITLRVDGVREEPPVSGRLEARNAGNAELEVQALEFDPYSRDLELEVGLADDSAVQALPARLAPGAGGLIVEAVWDGAWSGRTGGELTLRSNDPVRPVVEVRVSVRTVDFCVVVRPREHDFGTLGVGESAQVEVDVVFCQNGPFEVRSVGLTAESDPAFAVREAFETPARWASRDDSGRVVVEFAPATAGPAAPDWGRLHLGQTYGSPPRPRRRADRASWPSCCTWRRRCRRRTPGSGKRSGRWPGSWRHAHRATASPAARASQACARRASATAPRASSPARAPRAFVDRGPLSSTWRRWPSSTASSSAPTRDLVLYRFE